MAGSAAAVAASAGLLGRRSLAASCETQPVPGHRGIAVVTGGSRGIGAAVALALADEGYAVAVNFCGNSAAAEAVAEQIRSRGGKAATFQADVAVESDVIDLFEAVLKYWPDMKLTALVNNAGVLGNKASLEDVTTSEYRHIFDINVLGPILATREFARHAAEGGVVNISSGSAAMGQNMYGMSKSALNGMQAWLAPELAQKSIRMNSISPGVTRSDMTAKYIAANPGMEEIPMRRPGEPTEIANAVVFLLSEKASYVVGANLRVSGGRAPGSFIF